MSWAILPHVIYNATDLSLGASGGTRRRRLWLREFDYVEIWVRTTGKSGTSPTLDAAVQSKFPVSGAEFANVSGKAITQLTGATSLPNVQVITLTRADIVSSDLFLLLTIGGTSTPTWTVSVTLLGRGL